MDDILHTKLGPGLDFDPLKDKQTVSAVASNDGVIEPCLFCGGEGVESGDGTNAYILCIKCYSRGPICPPSEYLEGTDLDSIKLWNRKAL